MEAGQDAFLSKFSAGGATLVYSTYLGGTAQDQGNGIAVDSSGNAYVTGFTLSNDFPTVSPFQASNKATTYGTAFVAKVESRRLGPGLLHLLRRQRDGLRRGRCR